MKISPALASAALLLSAALAGCGGDEPAVCGSVDDLKASIEDVRSIDIESPDALTQLETGLETVKSDFDTVKADAKTELSSELGTVDSAYTAVTTAVEDAVAGPSQATLSAAGAALSAFGKRGRRSRQRGRVDLLIRWRPPGT